MYWIALRAHLPSAHGSSGIGMMPMSNCAISSTSVTADQGRHSKGRTEIAGWRFEMTRSSKSALPEQPRQDGGEHLQVGLRRGAAGPADHDAGVRAGLVDRPVLPGINARGDDRDPRVESPRVVGEPGVADDDVRAEPADRRRLARELQPAEGAVGRGGVEQEDRVVEVEDDRLAGAGEGALEHRGPGDAQGPVDEHRIIPPDPGDLRRAAAECPGQRRRLRRPSAGLVQVSHQRVIDERNQVHRDPPVLQVGEPLLQPEPLAGRRVRGIGHQGADGDRMSAVPAISTHFFPIQELRCSVVPGPGWPGFERRRAEEGRSPVGDQSRATSSRPSGVKR